METLSWLAELKAFGPLGLALIILALSLRAVYRAWSKSVDSREERNVILFKETLQVIREHSEAIKKQTETEDLKQSVIIGQIRRSERSIKDHIDKSKK